MSTVKVERPAEHVAVITLDRPERLNAIDFTLVADLHDALDTVAGFDTCKVAILTGAGRAFCAGLDLKDWGKPPAPGEHRFAPAGTNGQAFIASLIPHFRAVPQVLVAAVNGAAFGGGLSFALGCELRVAARSASFCSAYIRTGLTGTDIGVSYFLPRLIGAARAFDMILTGRAVDAGQAEHMGLVSRVFDDGELLDGALAMAGELASYTATGLRMTKEVIWANLEAGNLAACLAMENRNQDLAIQTREVQDFMRAYRDTVTGS